MEPEAYRAATIRALHAEGLAVPDNLPLIDCGELRSLRPTVDRLLCLHACAAASYGFPKTKSLAWARQEGLSDSFEEEELTFLNSHDAGARFQYQVEAMAALHWALGYEENIRWFDSIDHQFVSRLPDLKRSEATRDLRSNSRLRSNREITAAADLAYCLHWIVVEAALSHASANLPFHPYVAAERRRAFDWLIGTEPWYSITLDT